MVHAEPQSRWKQSEAVFAMENYFLHVFNIIKTLFFYIMWKMYYKIEKKWERSSASSFAVCVWLVSGKNASSVYEVMTAKLVSSVQTITNSGAFIGVFYVSARILIGSQFFYRSGWGLTLCLSFLIKIKYSIKPRVELTWLMIWKKRRIKMRQKLNLELARWLWGSTWTQIDVTSK